MTLPTLVQNYKKIEVSSQLKKFNSIMANALNLAIHDHNEPGYWDIPNNNSIPGTHITSEEWVNKYIKPYINIVAADYNNTYDGCGNLNSSIKKEPDTSKLGPSLLRASGLQIGGIQVADPDPDACQVDIGVHGNLSKVYNVKLTLNDKSTFYIGLNSLAYPILIDVNGNQKPNKLGSDRFLFAFSGQTMPELACGWNSKRYFCAKGNVNNSKNQPNMDREEALRWCNLTGETCSTLLEHDNWEFKKDYPRKL